MKYKLQFSDNSKNFQDAYSLLYSRCKEEDKELLNLIMIEGSVGFPFVDRIKKYFPYLIR